MLRPRYHIAAWVLVAALGVPATGTAETFSNLHALRQREFVENSEFHGFVLDDQHKLLVRQENNVATVTLRKWNRPPGGPFLYFDPETGEDASIIRYEDNIELYRIRVDVLIPAPPNYLQNHGQHYRVYVHGIEVAPDYAKVFEANAGDVLALLMEEIRRISNDTYGVYRAGVHFGGMIALRILNETGFLPSELATGTVRSRTFQTRIEGEHLGRRVQPRLERFPKRAGAMEFTTILGSELTGDVPSNRSWGTARNAVPTALEGAPVQPKAHRSRGMQKEAEARDHRERQTQGLTDQKSQQNPLGRPGRSLTTPEQELPAISASQMQSLDMLLEGGAPATGAAVKIQTPRTPVSPMERLEHSRRNRNN